LFYEELQRVLDLDIGALLLIIGLILAFIMAINIGGNDACNPTSPAIGAGVLTLRRALLFFAIFTILGATLQGFMVMKTIGSGIVPQINVVGAVSIVISAIIWVFFATMMGMNISTGHSLIAAVIGYGVVQYSLAGLNTQIIWSIILSWITSPLIALMLSFFLYRTFSAYLSKHQSRPERTEKYLKLMVIAALCFAAYSFGANDVSHATGVFLQITQQAIGTPNLTTMFILSLLGAVGMVIGGLTIGWRVIATMAYKVTRLDLTTALAASLGNSIVVYLFITTPFLIFGYGIPISSSYAAVGAIVGAGMGRSMKSVSRSTTLKLVGYWVLTIPVCITISAGLYLLLSQFI
jgi:PiT family inorganic phosphate transporter